MKVSNFIKGGIFFILSVLLFAGCTNQDNYVSQTHTVEIKDMQFQPADLQVHKGDTVIWINRDIVAHDVTEGNNAWASPPLASGASWEKVITKSEFYYCSIHVVMKGALTVVE